MRLLKIFLTYLAAPILAVTLFVIGFQLWNVDLHSPSFGYNTDCLLHIFYAKNIVDTGWIFSNDAVGLPHLTENFKMYDFPIQSDMFSILIWKLFALFTNNPFLIINCFFILTFVLVSASSFVALRSFKVSVFTATIISVIYTFLPYHLIRGVWHLFLSNYAIIPLSTMVALWIASDKIKIFCINKKQQYSVSWNWFFVAALCVSILAAISGVYYAYYSCVMFVFAWLLRGLKKGVFVDKNSLEPIFLCLTILVVLLYLYLPTLFYQIDHGFNPAVGGRATAQSEVYALRIIDLFMPVSGHYITYFSNLREVFNFFVDAGSERASASLGILGASGFLFLLLWLIGKNFVQENSFLERTIRKFSLSRGDQNLISDLAALNILSVLFATVGGFVMFISLPFPLIRSHVRFCLFIAFLSLMLIAIIFDKIVEKKLFGKKIYAQILLFAVMILAVLDQTGRGFAGYVQSHVERNQYINDRDFIAEIESSLPSKSMIFVLPVSSFPEVDFYQSLIGYINSKELRWSYPAMLGRESDVWQKRVSALDYKEFVSELKKVGFAGIYIDKVQYYEKYGFAKLREIESNLKTNDATPAIFSKNKQLVFYKI